nr:PREDICTED: uncharacterized protein LOC109035227 [Bemisia tabaci]
MESESKRRKQKCHPQRSMPAWCLIYLKFVIVIAGENVWSLAESISKGNATSVRSPNPSSDQASIKEPIGFRKIQFSNSSFQIVEFSMRNVNSINDFTACTWLKLESTTKNLTIFSYHPRDSKNSDGILKWWISDGGTSIQFWLKDKLVMKNEVKLGDGKWRHICQNWEGSSGHWTLHISGLKSLTGQVDEQSRNWTLPGTGAVRISSENGGEVYGFTLARQDTNGTRKRGARHTDGQNSTSPAGAEDPESAVEAEKPEKLPETAEALFWNRGSSRQVETRASSIGRVAAFLTRVIAFAIIPAMAIVNEMRKSRAKSNEVKNLDSQDDDLTFKLNDPTPGTTRAPEQITSTTPFNFEAFDSDFEKGNFGSVDAGNVNNAKNTGPNAIDPFFANDDDYFRSAENKHVARASGATSTSTSNQTRTSRSYSSQCQSSRLVQHSHRDNVTAASAMEDLPLLGSHCCWSDPPSENVIVSWFHTPLRSSYAVKLINISKSSCGVY